jgi:hypothetical protein
MFAHPVIAGDNVKGNVAVNVPAGTVIEAGTKRAGLPEPRTTRDEFGEAAVKVTVQVPL